MLKYDDKERLPSRAKTLAKALPDWLRLSVCPEVSKVAFGTELFLYPYGFAPALRNKLQNKP
jgi:hypothetical protein